MATEVLESLTPICKKKQKKKLSELPTLALIVTQHDYTKNMKRSQSRTIFFFFFNFITMVGQMAEVQY